VAHSKKKPFEHSDLGAQQLENRSKAQDSKSEPP
jgi:hypothetical protein